MKLAINSPFVQVYEGDALMTLRALPDDSVDCCVTSPPYWGLRDYGHADQIGLESSPFEYIEKMAAVFDEVRRVLKPSGTCWVVIGDSYANGRTGNHSGTGGKNSAIPIREEYLNGNVPRKTAGNLKLAGLKEKDLCGIPWRIAFALQERGWYLRQDIIWAKPNPMPESVTDRCTRSHEYVFMLTKRARYYYDAEAIMERAAYGDEHAAKATSWGTNRKHPNKANVAKYAFAGENSTTHLVDGIYCRNKRDVWSIQTEPCAEAHFATFPTKLVELCIKAGCPPDGVVLDPFGGCGTTGEVAVKLGRRAVLVELNAEYVEMIRKNLGLFALAASE